jgi:hypothetical protein
MAACRDRHVHRWRRCSCPTGVICMSAPVARLKVAAVSSESPSKVRIVAVQRRLKVES